MICNDPSRLRVAFVLMGFLSLGLFFALVPPLSQDQSYHRFADSRRLAEIPNGLNVLSNAPFLAVGIWGIASFARGRLVHDHDKSHPVYGVFFLGIALTGLGSAYYHWSPDNDTLVWDRLPMTLGFTALTVGILSEHVKPGLDRRILYPFAALGLLSVVYWHLTELHGRGDLRPYAIVQFLPMLVIPVVCLFYPSRFTRHQDLLPVLGFYGLAKLTEQFDGPVWEMTGGIVSGHTLKHLFAALGTRWVLRMLRLRRRK